MSRSKVELMRIETIRQMLLDRDAPLTAAAEMLYDQEIELKKAHKQIEKLEGRKPALATSDSDFDAD